MALEHVETPLEPRDYRAILAVLEVVGRAGSVDEFRRLAMQAVDEHLGHAQSTFFVGGPPDPGFALFEGSTQGLEQGDLREEAGRGDLSAFDSEQRLHIEQFLLRRSSCQLSLWLDTGLPQHGYLSIFGPRSSAFGPRDRASLVALRPHLSSLLRRILLYGRRAPGLEQLSQREVELARLLTLGCSNREIARHLGIQEDTVKKHLWRAMHKLRVRNRTELAMLLRPLEQS
jgi:DNA-binding CsgD family transcriptional regulator